MSLQLAPIMTISAVSGSATHQYRQRSAALKELQLLPRLSAQDFPVAGAVEVTGHQKARARKKLTVEEGFPTEFSAEKQRMKEVLAVYEQDTQLQALLTDVMHLDFSADDGDSDSKPKETIWKNQDPVINALAKLLLQLVAMLKLVFQQHSICDYRSTLGAICAHTNTDQGDISDITCAWIIKATYTGR